MVDYCLLEGYWYPLDVDERIKPIYEINTNGDVRNKNTGKILKPETDKDGYHRYSLQGYDKKVKFYRHRLTAMKFIYGDNSLQVNHKNAIKTDNHYSNLEWVTNKENIRHSLDNNLQTFVRGSKHGASIISEKEAIKVCKCILKGMRNEEIALKYHVKFGISKQQLKSIAKHIRSGKSWKHISCKFF